MLRITPGLISLCRGTAVVCLPHGHCHFSWIPCSYALTQSWARSALTKRRLLIGFTFAFYLTGLTHRRQQPGVSVARRLLGRGNLRCSAGPSAAVHEQRSDGLAHAAPGEAVQVSCEQILEPRVRAEITEYLAHMEQGGRHVLGA